MFTRTTHSIKITAYPVYLHEQSSPEHDSYVWAYTISIENLGEDTVQLLSRTWKITDGLGQAQHVTGSGVVGEQPVLESGITYQYTSGAVLPTPSGVMEGSYDMLNIDTGDTFKVVIPMFSLDSPQERARPN